MLLKRKKELKWLWNKNQGCCHSQRTNPEYCHFCSKGRLVYLLTLCLMIAIGMLLPGIESIAFLIVGYNSFNAKIYLVSESTSCFRISPKMQLVRQVKEPISVCLPSVYVGLKVVTLQPAWIILKNIIGYSGTFLEMMATVLLGFKTVVRYFERFCMWLQSCSQVQLLLVSAHS